MFGIACSTNSDVGSDTVAVYDDSALLSADANVVAMMSECVGADALGSVTMTSYVVADIGFFVYE